MGNLKNEFSVGLPQDRWFAGEKLGIGSSEGGPGVPQMLRSPKLQKRASDLEGPKMGVPKIAPPTIFLDLRALANGPKRGCKTHTPMCAP